MFGFYLVKISRLKGKNKILLNFYVFQVSGLFARDEMDEILQELIGPMKKDFPRRPPTNEALYEYYMSRCRQNLHVALCFSPVSTFKYVIKLVDSLSKLFKGPW